MTYKAIRVPLISMLKTGIDRKLIYLEKVS